MPEKSPEDPGDSLRVAWSDIARLVRQLSHDLRNDLNALELQSAYIAELTEDEELQTEIKRLREVVSDVNSTLKRLSGAVGEIAPNVISYRAPEFLADMRAEIERKFANKKTEINWDVQVQEVVLHVDPQLLQEVFLELFANAFQHDRGNGALLAMASISNDQLLFTLHEPKSAFDLATQNWGREPLQNISQRHYGLGLNRVRAILEAHGGQLEAHFDSKASALVSTVTLPVERVL
jgi:K+-sensing histidine kinase KdpD